MSMSDYIPGKRRRNGGPVMEDQVQPLPAHLRPGVGVEAPIGANPADFVGLADAFTQQHPDSPQAIRARGGLPAPIPPSPLSEPLHPLVTDLINKSQIVPIETAKSESARNKAAMLAELQAEIAKDDLWWDNLLAEANHRAAVSAALHVKLRAFYDAMAQARADYDAPELPAVKEKAEEKTGEVKE